MPRKPSRSQWVHLVRRIVVQSSLAGLWVWTVSTAQVQTDITPDGTMGTEVTQTGTIHDITGGTRPENGQNLFHSFDRFSVGTGDTANFASDPGVANIISRVTGGAESMIDGTLQAEANLFLLNPQGIMFGPHATLNVNGSFHASTADALRFADGATFSARLSERTTLTVAAPSAFGFLNENPAGITIEGSMLEVPEGETLSVVGGDIEIVGSPSTSLETPSLEAQNGQINIASVASVGEVVLSPSGQALHLNVDSFERLGEINVSQGAFINTSGEGGGTVLIHSGKLVLANAIITAETLGSEDGGGVDVEVEDLVLTDGALINTNTTNSGHGGNLTITATESISISGSDSQGNSSALFSNTFGSGDSGQVFISTPILVMDSGRIQSAVDSAGTGSAGGITVEVGSLELKNSAQIDGSSFGSGRGGTVTITATESISIAGRDRDGSPSAIFSNAFGEGDTAGDAGDLFISAPLFTIDGGRVVTRTEGDGNAGDIDIQVDRLVVTEGGQIFSGTGNLNFIDGKPIFTGTGGPGRGGNVTVIAHESVTISERGAGFDSGLFSNAQFGTGRAGDIYVVTPRLAMQGGLILSSSQNTSSGDAGNTTLEVGTLTISGGGQISASTGGSGRGGTVTITATESISIAGRDRDGVLSGVLTDTTGQGQGGDIILHSSQLLLTDGATISAQSSGQGNAGAIQVAVIDLTLRDHSVVTTEATQAGGGNIEIEAQILNIFDSDITATVGGGKGSGGNILIGRTINAKGDIIEGLGRLTLEGSRITANTDAGDGANIAIGARQVVLDGNSDVTANTNAGVGGNVTIAGTVAANGQALTRAEVIVLRNSRITAQSQEGKGGRIDIVTEAFLADPASVVDASSQEGGIDGEVNIEAVRTNLSEIVTPLSPHFAQTAALLSDPCASRLQRGIVSSFVARGRASVPATPDGLLPSRLYSRAIDPTESESAVSHEAPALNSHVRLSRRPCP